MGSTAARSAGSSVDVMAAVDTQVIVSRATRQGERTNGRTVPSYGDFKNAFRAAGLGLGNIYRQAAFDRLMEMAQKLVHRFALGRAAGNGPGPRPGSRPPPHRAQRL